MTVEIGFGYIGLSKQGALVIPGNNLLAVGIVHRIVLGPGVAGVAHCEMGTHLLRNQNRKLRADIIALRHHIGCGVGADGKFAQGQSLMVKEYIRFQELLIFGFIVEVLTAVGSDFSIFKTDFQIHIFQFIQIDLAHMKRTVGAGQLRRGKHLAHRDIHIGHTVLEDGLLRRILRLPQLHIHLRPVRPRALHIDVLALVQGVDELLLDALIQVIIQVVDLHNFPENLFVIVANLRNGPGNNCKAALVAGDVAVHQLTCLTVVRHHDLLLLCIQMQGRRTALGHKRMLAKNLHDCRPRMDCRQLLILLVGAVQHT